MKRIIAVFFIQLAGRQLKCIMHGLISPDHPQIRIKVQDEFGHGIENDRFLLL